MNFTPQSQITCVALSTLGSHVSRDQLETWWSQLCIHLRNTQFKDVMYLEWTTGTNRGFTDVTTEGKTITAVSKSNQVEAMIDQITGFIPELNPSVVRAKAT